MASITTTEPPIRRCPQYSGLCYDVPTGTYNCPTCGTFDTRPARINSPRLTRFADEGAA